MVAIHSLAVWLLIVGAAELVQLTAKVAQLESEQHALKSEQDVLKNEQQLRGDRRLHYFSHAVPGSSGKHSVANGLIDEYYDNQCLLCGATGATKAHLVVGTSELTYEEFNPPHYNTPLDVKSVRNFIPLCGILGQKGTCHDAFDKYTVTMLCDVSHTYYWYCLDRNFTHYAAVHLKPVHRLHPDHRPYTRVLAWRTRKCYNEYPYWVDNTTIDVLASAVDLSETSSTGGGGSSSSSSSAGLSGSSSGKK